MVSTRIAVGATAAVLLLYKVLLVLLQRRKPERLHGQGALAWEKTGASLSLHSGVGSAGGPDASQFADVREDAGIDGGPCAHGHRDAG